MGIDFRDENPFAAPKAGNAPVRSAPSDLPARADGTYGVTYQNTAADIAALMNRHQRKGIITAIPLLVPLLIVGIGLVMAWQGPPRVRLTVSVISLAWGLMIWVLFRWSRRRLTAKMARTFHQRPQQSVEIGPQGVTVRLAGGAEARSPWRGMGAVEVAEAGLFLYDAKSRPAAPMAHIVPRRAFDTPEAFATFSEAAARWRRVASDLTAGSTPAPPARTAGGLSVTYLPTLDERRAAQRRGRSQYGKLWRTLLGNSLVVLVLTVASILWLVSAWRSSRGRWAAVVPPAALVVVNLLLAASTSRAWRIVLFGVPESDGPPAPITVTISPEGCAVSHDGGTASFVPWWHYAAVGSDRASLTLTLRPQSTQMRAGPTTAIPRRAFADPEEVESFLDAARTWHAEAQKVKAGAANAGEPTP